MWNVINATLSISSILQDKSFYCTPVEAMRRLIRFDYLSAQDQERTGLRTDLILVVAGRLDRVGTDDIYIATEFPCSGRGMSPEALGEEI